MTGPVREPIRPEALDLAWQRLVGCSVRVIVVHEGYDAAAIFGEVEELVYNGRDGVHCGDGSAFVPFWRERLTDLVVDECRCFTAHYGPELGIAVTEEACIEPEDATAGEDET